MRAEEQLKAQNIILQQLAQSEQQALPTAQDRPQSRMVESEKLAGLRARRRRRGPRDQQSAGFVQQQRGRARARPRATSSRRSVSTGRDATAGDRSDTDRGDRRWGSPSSARAARPRLPATRTCRGSSTTREELQRIEADRQGPAALRPGRRGPTGAEVDLNPGIKVVDQHGPGILRAGPGSRWARRTTARLPLVRCREPGYARSLSSAC